MSEWKAGYAKVHFREDNIVSGWWPVLSGNSKSDKESWPLEVNEHVAVICDQYCEDGVVLGAIANKNDVADSGGGPGKFRKVFSDGTVIEYDKNSHELKADVKGKIIAQAEVSAKVTAPAIEAEATATAKIKAPAIMLEGNVSVTGTVAVAGALSAAGITATGGTAISGSGNISTSGTIQGSAVKAGAIDLAAHKHAGVQTGSGSTGPALP